MKRQTWILAIGGVLILAFVSGGTGLAMGQRGGFTNGAGLNGAGYGGMMNGGMPFGGMMNGGQLGGPGGMMGGTGGSMMGGSTAVGGPSLTIGQAQQAVQATLDKFGNQDLAIDEVMEFQDNFYALVKEQSSGHGAFELLVTKSSGAVFPEYGPNMLWNTKYGMMGTQSNAKPMPVSSDQAKALATTWLAQNQPGVAAETPDTFAGYYTVHLTKDGAITGMLSVNGYTGQLWYHTWHGTFVRMQ